MNFCIICKNKLRRLRTNTPLCGNCYSSSIYGRWRHMISRCNNPSNVRYYQYGGRGIKICDRWLEFKNYYEDVGNVPFEGAELDRINPDGNYEPSNCRWVTRKENANNKRWGSKYRDTYQMVHIDKLCTDCRKKIFPKGKSNEN